MCFRDVAWSKMVVMTSRAIFGRPGSANLTAGVKKDRRLENYLGTIRNVYFKSCGIKIGNFWRHRDGNRRWFLGILVSLNL